MSETPRTDAVEKNFGEMPGEMRKMEKELAAALASNQRLEKERDEARKLVEEYSQDLMTQREVAAKLHATISADRDRLMADVVTLRKALERIANAPYYEFGSTLQKWAKEALALIAPFAPKVDQSTESA